MGRETITKRLLPHWYQPGAAHFVTFRLANSLPRAVLEDLRERKELLLQRRANQPEEPLSLVHKRLFSIYDEHLDRGCGAPLLADPRIAAMVRGSLYFLHRDKLALLA